MSNFKGSVNLLQLLGAQVVTIEVGGKPQTVVAIPTGWNDIKVTANDQGEPTAAYLNLRGWETGDAFRKACIERNADQEGYLPPSHQLQVSYREEFQKAAEQSAEKRLRADTAFMAKGLSEVDIIKEAKYAVSNKSRIGTLTPLVRKEAPAYSGQAPAANAEAWTPDAEKNYTEDLPF